MSILEIAGAGSIEHGGNFWHLLIEDTPAVPSHSTKIMSCKPDVLDKCTFFWVTPIQNVSTKVILQAFHLGNDSFLHQSSTVPLSLSLQVDVYCLLCLPLYIFMLSRPIGSSPYYSKCHVQNCKYSSITSVNLKRIIPMRYIFLEV